MRISLNTNNKYNKKINFKGIKVKKEQEGSSVSKPNSRQHQENMFKQGISQIEMLRQVAKANDTGAYNYLQSDYIQSLPVGNKEKQDAYIRAQKEIESQILNAQMQLDTMLKLMNDISKKDTANIAKHDSAKRIEANKELHNRSGMEKFAGYDYERKVLNKEFIQKVKDEKEGENVQVPGSILFFGPNENGKTTITYAVAEETKGRIEQAVVRFGSQEKQIHLMKQLKQIAQNSKEQFKKDRTRTIIFIDELDNFINEDSPVKDEFVEFIKTCSEKYHCTVFAATNNPLDLGLDLKDPDIFPIIMSIDPADKKDKLKIIEYYLSGFDINIGNEEVLEMVLNKEKETNAKFTNGQIMQLCMQITEEADIDNYDSIIEKISEWFEDNEPFLSEQRVDKFTNDYRVVMGKEKRYED